MILIVSAMFPPEPVVAASMTHDLADLLSDSHKVRVITPQPTRPLGYPFPHFPAPSKFEHIILRSFTCPGSKITGRLLESFSFGRHAARHIRDNHMDIECCYVSSWPLAGQYLIIRALKKYSIPAVTHIQDIYPESLAGKLPFLRSLFIKMLLPIDKYVHRGSKKIIAISPGMRSFLSATRSIDRNMFSVIYNWQNEARFYECRKAVQPDADKDGFTFMFLGSLNRTAAVHILIRAFDLCRMEHGRLIIAGNGPEKESLKQLASSCNNRNIEFLDAPAGKVPELQMRADVLLLNLKKGAAKFALPSKLIAYMFSERPVIACLDEESDAADVIREAECGWVVPPENINELSRNMIMAASCEKEYLMSLGSNGFRFASDNFSSERNVRKLAAEVIEIIDKP